MSDPADTTPLKKPLSRVVISRADKPDETLEGQGVIVLTYLPDVAPGGRDQVEMFGRGNDSGTIAMAAMLLKRIQETLGAEGVEAVLESLEEKEDVVRVLKDTRTERDELHVQELVGNPADPAAEPTVHSSRVPMITEGMVLAACEGFMFTMTKLRGEIRAGDKAETRAHVIRAMAVAIGAALMEQPSTEESQEFGKAMMLQVATMHGATCGCSCDCDVTLTEGNVMAMEIPRQAGVDLPPGAHGLMSAVCLACFTGEHPPKAGEEWKGP